MAFQVSESEQLKRACCVQPDTEWQPRRIDSLFDIGIRARKAACGASHTCKLVEFEKLCAVILTESGDVYGWGLNSHGQVGVGGEGDQDADRKAAASSSPAAAAVISSNPA